MNMFCKLKSILSIIYGTSRPSRFFDYANVKPKAWKDRIRKPRSSPILLSGYIKNPILSLIGHAFI